VKASRAVVANTIHNKLKVSVVILNWNTKGYLQEFLPGVIQSCEGFGEAVVADSASTDGSFEMLVDDYPELKLIPLESNFGFTGGYNRALRLLDSEYFVLLNSDIQVSNDWLKPLVEWMDTHPECAVCGPKLHALVKEPQTWESDAPIYKASDNFEYAGAAGGYIDKFGFPYCRGRVLKKVEKDIGQYDKARNVMWISGACMMVRRSVWEELGGLDEQFFAHMEEIDFCWRARLAGWEVTVVPQSVVWHLGGGTLSPESPLKLKLNFRNNLLMMTKNLPATIGRSRAAFRLFTRKTLDLVAALVYLLTLKPIMAKAVYEAHMEFISMRRRVEVTKTDKKPKGTWVKMMRIHILPAAFFKGKNIFKYLKRYEDNH